MGIDSIVRLFFSAIGFGRELLRSGSAPFLGFPSVRNPLPSKVLFLDHISHSPHIVSIQGLRSEDSWKAVGPTCVGPASSRWKRLHLNFVPDVALSFRAPTCTKCATCVLSSEHDEQDCDACRSLSIQEDAP